MAYVVMICMNCARWDANVQACKPKQVPGPRGMMVVMPARGGAGVCEKKNEITYGWEHCGQFEFGNHGHITWTEG